VGEYEHAIEQCLAAKPGASLLDIKEVLSHPYAFEQCRPFLASLPGKKLVQTFDTASACRQIQESESNLCAAVASVRAAQLYGLEVLARIENSSITRYALVSRTPIIPERHLNPRTTFQVNLKNQVASLMKAVSAFAMRDINISKIESRPSSRSIILRKPWEYVVYIEVDAGMNDPRMAKAIANIEEFGGVKILGSYPRYQQIYERVGLSVGV
jgi:prephenate dehydratase